MVRVDWGIVVSMILQILVVPPLVVYPILVDIAVVPDRGRDPVRQKPS